MHYLSFVISKHKKDFSFLEQYENWNEKYYIFKETDVEKEIAETKTIKVIDKNILNLFELNYIQNYLDKFYHNKKFIPVCLLPATVKFEEAGSIEISNYYAEEINRYAIDILGLVEKDGKFGEYYNPNGIYEDFCLGGKWDFFLPVKQKYLKEVISRKEKLKYKNNRFYANQLLLKEVDFTFMKENFRDEILKRYKLFKTLGIQLEPFNNFKKKHSDLDDERIVNLYYVENEYVINLMREVFGREKLYYAYPKTKIFDIEKEARKYINFLSKRFVFIVQEKDGYLDIAEELFEEKFEKIINSPENQDSWISVLDLNC